MNSTGYKSINFSTERLAHGYYYNRDDEQWTDWGTTQQHLPYNDKHWYSIGKGDIHSTIEDLYKWHVALNDDVVLTSKTREMQETAYVAENDKKTSFYGYGWAISKSDRGTKIVAHNGSNGLYFADFVRFIDDDVVLARNHYFETLILRMRQVDFCCGAARYWTRTDWKSYLDKSYHISHIQNILRYKTYLPSSIERVTGNPSYHEFSFIGNFGTIKRKVFEKVRGFDENYKEWSYQDTDLMMRLCMEGFHYFILSHENISVYHLSHGVDKSTYLEHNKKLFQSKQKEIGLDFHLNHFFGIFDDDNYPILS